MRPGPVDGWRQRVDPWVTRGLIIVTGDRKTCRGRTAEAEKREEREKRETEETGAEAGHNHHRSSASTRTLAPARAHPWTPLLPISALPIALTVSPAIGLDDHNVILRRQRPPDTIARPWTALCFESAKQRGISRRRPPAFQPSPRLFPCSDDSFIRQTVCHFSSHRHTQ